MKGSNPEDRLGRLFVIYKFFKGILMSFSHDIPAATQVFSKNLHMLAQQSQSKLSDAVRIESMSAASQFFERAGTIEMVENTSRHQDTPFTPVPFSRRRVDIRNFSVSDIIDGEEDAMKMLIDPQSATTSTFLKAGNRNLDSIIINNGLLGSAVSTDASFGVTQVAAPTAIADGSTNLPVSKIKDAIERMQIDDVDLAEDRPYLVISPSQYRSLLSDNEFINRDFRIASSNMPLNVTTMNEILGVNIRIVSQDLLPVASNIRTCVMFTKGSVVVGMQNRFKVESGKDYTKNGSIRIIGKQNLGAVRMEEARVVPISCDETAT